MKSRDSFERINRAIVIVLSILTVVTSNIHFKNAIIKDNKVSLPLIPHQTVINRRLEENRRRRVSLPDHQQVSTLYQGYGTHYIDLWVGTPIPQRQTVIVDTGSQLIAFPCSECHDCGDSYHTDGYYNENESETFKKLTCGDGCTLGSCTNNQCHLGLSYQEGSSWSAYEAVDVMYAGGMHDEPESQIEDASLSSGDDIHHASAFSFDVRFGCQTSLTGLFKTQLADGIMGMSDEGGAFWRQMFAAGVIKKKQFSLCFSRQTMVAREGTLAGAITLGGRDDDLSSMPLVYALNVKQGGFYTVRLKNIFLWKEKGRGIKSAEELMGMQEDVRALDIAENLLNSGGVIVDSGTTDTYFNHQVGSAFHTVWKDMMGSEYGNNEVELTEEQLFALPTILFQMSGDVNANQALSDNPNSVPGLVGDLDTSSPYDILVAMPASHYMEYDPDKQKYIPRFYTDEYGGSVLGANFMMGHDVLFDVDNKRLGFTESDCDYLALLNPSYTKKEKEEEVDDFTTEEETTPFAHPNASNDDEKLCDRQCESILALSILVTMSLVTAITKYMRWRRRYSTVDDFVPAVELSSQHGDDDDDDDHVFSIGDDDEFLDPKRRII